MLTGGETMSLTLYYVANQDIIEYDAALLKVENSIFSLEAGIVVALIQPILGLEGCCTSTKALSSR